MGLGGGVKFLIYFLERGGGRQPGNPSGYTLAYTTVCSRPEDGIRPLDAGREQNFTSTQVTLKYRLRFLQGFIYFMKLTSISWPGCVGQRP